MPYWWENLQRKEKAAAAASALAIALLVVYLLLQPFFSSRARLQKEVSNRRLELAWMRDAAREIGELGYAGQGQSAATPPLQLIDQLARENRLSDQLKRLEPGSEGEIKVWLNNAVYVDMIRWLRQLTATGRFSIANLNVQKGSTPGVISAQLTLNSGGPR
ncbi:MAG TPA: type II secretion system protein GspM [Desulfurivibrionaceae bacterium]|nr:type II secretion system protein GspM [Desulfurivibrionaceae bacterium]